MAAALRKLVVPEESCSSNNRVEKFNHSKQHIKVEGGLKRYSETVCQHIWHLHRPVMDLALWGKTNKAK